MWAVLTCFIYPYIIKELYETVLHSKAWSPLLKGSLRWEKSGLTFCCWPDQLDKIVFEAYKVWKGADFMSDPFRMSLKSHSPRWKGKWQLTVTSWKSCMKNKPENTSYVGMCFFFAILLLLFKIEVSHLIDRSQYSYAELIIHQSHSF